MFYTIYKTTNLINGKFYIGKHVTNDLNDCYMGSGKYLKRSMKKYGIENFSKEILFVLDTEEEMNFVEKQLVTLEFCERVDTYNICEGGQGGFSYINNKGIRNGFEHRPDEQKVYAEIARKAHKEKLECDEYRKAYSESMSKSLKEYIEVNGAIWSGKKHTEETKEKLRKTKNNGSTNSQFGTMWITNGVENSKVKKNSLIPDGWRKGRVTKK